MARIDKQVWDLIHAVSRNIARGNTAAASEAAEKLEDLYDEVQDPTLLREMRVSIEKAEAEAQADADEDVEAWAEDDADFDEENW